MKKSYEDYQTKLEELAESVVIADLIRSYETMSETIKDPLIHLSDKQDCLNVQAGILVVLEYYMWRGDYDEWLQSLSERK